MPGNSLPHATALMYTRVDLIAYMCAASSFVLGPEGNLALCERLSEAAGGLPAFTASTSMAAALKAVGATRVAVLAPHPPEIAEKLGTYLEASGFGVTGLSALGLELAAINDSPPGKIYQAVRRLDLAGADAIFIAATNFRALDVIEAVEADTGLPVVTSNQAALWQALGILGVERRRPGFGRLLNAA
jgi:maleate isomerase